MKKFYLSVLAVLACLASFSATLTATGGNWNVTTSWSPQQLPANNDIIIIPNNVTINVPTNTTISLAGVQIRIDNLGTLTLVSNNANLNLTSSGISVLAGGSITRTKNNSNVSVNSTLVFANGINSTTGAQNYGTVTLPVKFTGFSVARQNSDVLVQWSTAEEVNADSYIIERSTDGNSWTGITTVAARGNTSSLTNYTYIDKSVTAAIAYYRVKQVDADGKYTYTTIKAIKAGAAAVDVKVAAINNRVVLQFSNEVKGAVEVRLVTLGGQVVSREVLHEPVGQVILNCTPAKGSYVVSVSNAQEIHVAKQIRF